MDEDTPEAAEMNGKRPVALEEEEDILLKAEKRQKAPEDPPIWDTEGVPEEDPQDDDWEPLHIDTKTIGFEKRMMELNKKPKKMPPPGYWLSRHEEDLRNFLKLNEEAGREADEEARKNDVVLKSLIKHGMTMHWHMVVDESVPVVLSLPPVEEESWPRESLPRGCVDLKFGYNPDIWRLRDFGGYGDGGLANVIQIYKLKLTSSLYPLDVYGEMTLYAEDNIPQTLFFRDRDHPQTITETDPYLLLTGPFCPPFFYPPGGLLCLIKARLILKGTTKSYDKYLTLSQDVGVDYQSDRLCLDDYSDCCETFSVDWQTPGKPYQLHLIHGIVIYTIVASISVELLAGNLDTGGYYFTAIIDKSWGKEEEVVLLDSRHGKEDAVLEDKKFKLSRGTICVENGESLTVHIEHDNFSQDLEIHHAAGNEYEVRTVRMGSLTLSVRVDWLAYDDVYSQTSRRYREKMSGTVQQEGAAGKL